MAKNPSNDEIEIASRTRWGGILLAAGSLLAIVALALLVSLPALSGPVGAARATQLASNADTVRWTGYTGMIGMGLTTLAAVFLSTRAQPNRYGLPAASWLVVALGGLVATVTYGIFGTGYLALAQNFATAGAVFSATGATTSAFAGLANIALGVGTIMVLTSEATSDTRAIPAALAYAGMLGSVGVLIVGVGYLTGVTSLLVAAPLGFLLDAVLIGLAARIVWPAAANAATPASRSAKA